MKNHPENFGMDEGELDKISNHPSVIKANEIIFNKQDELDEMDDNDAVIEAKDVVHKYRKRRNKIIKKANEIVDDKVDDELDKAAITESKSEEILEDYKPDKNIFSKN